MVFWNRNMELKKISTERSEEILSEYATSDTVGIHTFLNYIINFSLPIVLFFVFKFSVLKLAIAFIVTDIVLIFLNWFIFHYMPYVRTKTLSNKGIRRRVEKMQKARAKLQKQLDDGEYDYEKRERIRDDINKLTEFILIEEKYIDAKEQEANVKKIEQDKRKVKDFDDKIEYLEQYLIRIKHYRKNYKVDMLKPVETSIAKLIDVLKRRPIGLTILPQTLYIYLDELQVIVEKICGLGNEYIGKYSKDILTIGNGLNTNIMELIEKIDRYDADDIEVGINVLLQELDNENKKDEV